MSIVLHWHQNNVKDHPNWNTATVQSTSQSLHAGAADAYCVTVFYKVSPKGIFCSQMMAEGFGPPQLPVSLPKGNNQFLLHL